MLFKILKKLTKISLDRQNFAPFVTLWPLYLDVAVGGPAVLGGGAGDQVRHDGTAGQLAGRPCRPQLRQLLVEGDEPGLLLLTAAKEKGGGQIFWNARLSW